MAAAPKKKLGFIPAQDFVLIKRADTQSRTDGGIYIPETAQTKAPRGEVLAVGPGKWGDNGKRIEPQVKTGDTVLLAEWTGTELKLDGQDVLLVRESDILGVEG